MPKGKKSKKPRQMVPWDDRFTQLVEYKQKHDGDTNVPRSHPLGSWVNTQRAAYRKGKMPGHRIKLFDDIGFQWVIRTIVVIGWDGMFAQLVEYKQKHDGDMNVPRSHPLGSWVNTQRTAYRKGKIPGHRIKRLDDIGFQWVIRTVVVIGWDGMFAKLVEYKQKHGGDTNVPQSHKPLGSWVMNQRARKGKMSDYCIKRLDDIGFQWELRLGRPSSVCIISDDEEEVDEDEELVVGTTSGKAGNDLFDSDDEIINMYNRNERMKKRAVQESSSTSTVRQGGEKRRKVNDDRGISAVDETRACNASQINDLGDSSGEDEEEVESADEELVEDAAVLSIGSTLDDGTGTDVFENVHDTAEDMTGTAKHAKNGINRQVAHGVDDGGDQGDQDEESDDDKNLTLELDERITQQGVDEESVEEDLFDYGATADKHQDGSPPFEVDEKFQSSEERKQLLAQPKEVKKLKEAMLALEKSHEAEILALRDKHNKQEKLLETAYEVAKERGDIIEEQNNVLVHAHAQYKVLSTKKREDLHSSFAAKLDSAKAEASKKIELTKQGKQKEVEQLMKVHEKELAKANAKVNALQEKLMPKSFALRGMKKCALQEEKSSVCSLNMHQSIRRSRTATALTSR